MKISNEMFLFQVIIFFHSGVFYTQTAKRSQWPMSRRRGAACRPEQTTLAQHAARNLLFVLMLPVLLWYSCARRRSLTSVFNKLLHRATNHHIWCAPLFMWMSNGELLACHYTATRLFASAVREHPARIVAARDKSYTINAWVSCDLRPLRILIGWPASYPQHYHALYYCEGVMLHSAMFVPPTTRTNQPAGFPLRRDVVNRSRKVLDRIANKATYTVRRSDVALILFDIEQILNNIPNLEALVDTAFNKNTCLVELDRTADPDERVCLQWPH